MAGRTRQVEDAGNLGVGYALRQAGRNRAERARKARNRIVIRVMETRTSWIRVDRLNPCVICRKPDWCTRSAEGDVVCCMRIPSQTRMQNGGYLYRIGEKRSYPMPPRREEQPKPRNLDALAAFHRQCVRQPQLAEFAASIGVTAHSLERLSVGFDGEAWTFPMVDCDGNTIGIRRRFADGTKLSVRGGREGLFVPTDGGDLASLVVVCEGPTDTAAILDADFYAIGRPSCLGGTDLIRRFVGRRDVVIIADVDEAGRGGAHRLADDLAMIGRTVKVIEPLKGKDARQWRPSRATLATVIRCACVWRNETRKP